MPSAARNGARASRAPRRSPPRVGRPRRRRRRRRACPAKAVVVFVHVGPAHVVRLGRRQPRGSGDPLERSGLGEVGGGGAPGSYPGNSGRTIGLIASRSQRPCAPQTWNHDRATGHRDAHGLAERRDHVVGEEEGVEPRDDVEGIVLVHEELGSPTRRSASGRGRARGRAAPVRRRGRTRPRRGRRCAEETPDAADLEHAHAGADRRGRSPSSWVGAALARRPVLRA